MKIKLRLKFGKWKQTNVGLSLGVIQRNHHVISCYTDSSLFIKECRLVDICAICEINNLLGFSV